MEELLTVSAVARRLGVAPATLRTWAHRYGLGPSEHQAGHHRRYGAEDLAKLTVMRRLITAGVTPAEAAKAAKSHKGKINIEKIISNCRDCDDVIDIKRIPKTVETIAFHDTVFINADFTTLPNLKNVTMIFNKRMLLRTINTKFPITIEFRGRKILVPPGEKFIAF
jgi:DNA-binding transcriptional MerR regulator